jgi:hypothetical protein
LECPILVAAQQNKDINTYIRRAEKFLSHIRKRRKIPTSEAIQALLTLYKKGRKFKRAQKLVQLIEKWKRKQKPPSRKM